MDEDTAFLIIRLSAITIFIPTIIAFINFRKFNIEQKILSYLLMLSILIEIISAIYSELGDNNLFLLHIFTVFEFVIIAMIYREKLQPIINKKLLTALMFCFAIFAIINTLTNEGLQQFNSFAKGIESLIVIVFTLIYFYKILIEIKIKQLEKEPMFWLNAGFLIYFSAGFIIFIFGNYIEPSIKLSFTFWGIHGLLTIFKNIFFAITLWIKPPKTT